MKKARLLITALMLFAAALYAGAQNISVSGTVIDAGNGDPVVGATVQLKGSATKYSITDLDGRYSLSAVPSNGTLVVTLIGFKTAEFPINGRAQIDLPLSVDTEILEDAIIVGYGSAKKISAITGSAATVGAKLLQNAPVASVGDALQGQVAGLQVWSNSGEPSATISMRIRGVNSISADTEPLFVLDGSPVPASIFSALNANDIENITVMKDASATSIYGSRAANGVVFITTAAFLKCSSLSTAVFFTALGAYSAPFATSMDLQRSVCLTICWFSSSFSFASSCFTFASAASLLATAFFRSSRSLSNFAYISALLSFVTAKKPPLG